MPDVLLNTKLFQPPPRRNQLSRPRLLARLGEGLSPDVRLILVSAPAGFGKTTLVGDWLHRDGKTAGWLSLDENDNDPVRFWRYVDAAFATIDPQLGEILRPALNSGQPPPISTYITSLLNDMSAIPEPLLLVLDDYHVIHNEAIHQEVNFLLDHQPPQFHLIITTRSDPPLQISRRRGRFELCELRAADLRFTQHEMAAFLNDQMHLGLTAADLQSLENRTEGWVVGLQMAALSLQSTPDRHAFIEAFSGDDRYVADYLVEEVLQRQPEHIQDFLLKTSILEQLSAPLCDALTGRNDSQDILNDLEHSNLFIIPLDNRREWFRYHLLFASLLRQNLTQALGYDAILDLQRRVYKWYAQHGYPIEAISVALSWGEYEDAALLIEKNGEMIFQTSQLNTLMTWAEQLPEPLIAAHPKLCVMFGWGANATGRNQACQNYVLMVERAAGMTVAEFLEAPFGSVASNSPAHAALVDAAAIQVRLVLDRADFQTVLSLADRLLPYLTSERDALPHSFNPPSALRPPIVFMIGMVYRYTGDLPKSAQLFQEAVKTSRITSNVHIIALGLGSLGQVQAELGDLQAAAETFRQAQQEAGGYASHPSAFFANASVGMGQLEYEWNDLEAAQRSLQAGISLGKLWNHLDSLVPGYICLAKVSQARGNEQSANQLLDELDDLVVGHYDQARPAIAAQRALFAVQQGNLEVALQWADTSTLTGSEAIPYLLEEEALVLARILRVVGHNQQAVTILQRLRMSAEKGHRLGKQVSATFNVALARQTLGEHERARQLTWQALELAQKSGYRRTFLDEGQVGWRLLQDARKQAGEQPVALLGYLDELLGDISREPGAEPPGPALAQIIGSSLAEPLSSRELEVLHWMAEGASNAEIAEKLVISPNTVKKHVSNIFGKLGATTRIQAVEYARHHQLIE
jgi:LuxR family maltose regulon positive regulatory protein